MKNYYEIKEAIESWLRPDGLLPVLKDNMIKTTAEYDRIMLGTHIYWECIDAEKRERALKAVTLNLSDGQMFLLRRPVVEGGTKEVEQWDDIIAYCYMLQYYGTAFERNKFIDTLRNNYYCFDQRPYTDSNFNQTLKERIRCTLQPWQWYVANQMCLTLHNSIYGLLGLIQTPFVFLLDVFKPKSITSGRLLLWLISGTYPMCNKWYVKVWYFLMRLKYRKKIFIQDVLAVYYPNFTLLSDLSTYMDE